MEIETKKSIEKINETKNWFSEMVSNTDKPLARLIKKTKESRPKSIKSVMEKWEVITNTTEIQKIIREYYEQLYTDEK